LYQGKLPAALYESRLNFQAVFYFNTTEPGFHFSIKLYLRRTLMRSDYEAAFNSLQPHKCKAAKIVLCGFLYLFNRFPNV